MAKWFSFFKKCTKCDDSYQDWKDQVCIINGLNEQIKEKDRFIDALKRELNNLAMSYKVLMKEPEAQNEELWKENRELNRIIRDLRLQIAKDSK